MVSLAGAISQINQIKYALTWTKTTKHILGRCIQSCLTVRMPNQFFKSDECVPHLRPVRTVESGATFNLVVAYLASLPGLQVCHLVLGRAQ